MYNKKMIVLAATAALAASLALAGCGGSQAAPSSAEEPAADAAPAAAETEAAPDGAAPAEAAPAEAAPASEPAAAESAPAAAPAAADSYIGDQQAMDIALADAKFAAADVTELEVELDLDDPTVHYDVSFKQGGMEYDYDIDATTGAILASTSEVDD